MGENGKAQGRLAARLAGACAVALLLAGCGGGGSEAQSATPVAPKILNWTAPTTFADGTPLDPARDLNIYEFYVNTSGAFSAGDTPMAYVSAFDSSTGTVATSFNLANLSQFLTPGVQYHVAIRSVALNGNKSAFSASAAFSL